MRFTRNFVTMNFPLLSEDEESFNEYKLACILLMKKADVTKIVVTYQFE